MEQTLMGDSDFANAMVPPSPPRNMSDLVQPSVNAPVSIAAIGGNSSNSAKERDTKRDNAAVPKLRIAAPAGGGGSGGADSDDDETEYEYSVPLSERETALTARDRDLIEQGDWSEIHDELSDNDFSLLGHRAGHKPSGVGKASKVVPSQQAVGGMSIAPVGSGAVSGGAIQNPRGGRHFRSAAAIVEEPAVRAAPQAQVAAGAHLHFKNHSGGFQIEDSDEDSVQGNSGPQGKNAAGGRKGGNSPRRAVDKLDPIPLPNFDEPGILSGRRIEKSNLSARGNPSSGGAGAGGGGYAPIYPSLGGGGGRSERADKERDAQNVKFSHIVMGAGPAGGAGRGREEDWSAAEERAKKEGAYKAGAAQPSGQSKYSRRNSQEQFSEDPTADSAADNQPSGGNEGVQLMVGVDGPVAVVGRSNKAGNVARNGALSRLKNNHALAAGNNENSEFSLNVYGNGFGGGVGSNAVAPAGGAPIEASQRPANKVKANAR